MQKGVVRIRIFKKNRQQNDQKKKDKRTKNGQQDRYETEDRVTRTPLNPGVNSDAPEG